MNKISKDDENDSVWLTYDEFLSFDWHRPPIPRIVDKEYFYRQLRGYHFNKLRNTIPVPFKQTGNGQEQTKPKHDSVSKIQRFVSLLYEVHLKESWTSSPSHQDARAGANKFELVTVKPALEIIAGKNENREFRSLLSQWVKGRQVDRISQVDGQV